MTSPQIRLLPSRCDDALVALRPPELASHRPVQQLAEGGLAKSGELVALEAGSRIHDGDASIMERPLHPRHPLEMGKAITIQANARGTLQRERDALCGHEARIDWKRHVGDFFHDRPHGGD